MFPDAEYAGAEATLQSGDRLLLYTDGITEVRNSDDDEFGIDRLSAVLDRYRHLGTAELHSAVMHEVMQFADAGFQDDDHGVEDDVLGDRYLGGAFTRLRRSENPFNP